MATQRNNRRASSDEGMTRVSVVVVAVALGLVGLIAALVVGVLGVASGVAWTTIALQALTSFFAAATGTAVLAGLVVSLAKSLRS